MRIRDIMADGTNVNPWLRRHIVRATSLVVLIASAACYDQAFVPGYETDDGIAITNDEIELERRVKYVDEEIFIEPPTTPMVATPSGWAAASVGPALIPQDITLTLRGEASSPVVNGEPVQATMIQSSQGNRAIVSYNTRGNASLGAIDLFQFQGDQDPSLRSSAQFTNADVSAVAVDASFAYAAQASGDASRPAPAIVERFVVTSSKLTLDGLVTAQLGSFVATSAVSDGSIVYATSGDAGSVYALDPANMSVLAEYALDNARWVELDATGNRVVVAQGTPGRLSVFEAGNFSGGTLNLLNTFSFPGADVADSKTSFEIHGGKAFIAAGTSGVQIVCLDNGQIVGSVPRPDPGELGLDPSVVVTNSVTVEGDLMFISNGEAGVYAAAAYDDFDDTPCADAQPITLLGQLQFDDLQSANHVEYSANRLWVAAGLGGVKVVRVRVR